MGFSKDVKEKASLACGRRCCICEKFSGRNIEFHHIKQEADGGENTFENCIPVCFDCHADVGHYNPKHPKGNKYSETELRARRDLVYERVEDGFYVKEEDEILDKDKEKLIKVIELIEELEIIDDICKQDFIAPFKNSILENTDILVEFCGKKKNQLKNNRYQEVINDLIQTLCKLSSIILNNGEHTANPYMSRLNYEYIDDENNKNHIMEIRKYICMLYNEIKSL